MSFPYINAYQQFFDSSGAPLASGTIEFRDPTTNNLIDSFPTADDADAQTNANDNPLTLSATGAADTGLFLEDGVAYKVIVKDVSGATAATHDDVRCPIALPYLVTAAETAAGVTPTNVEYPPGNVLRYGTNTTPGTTDMTTAFTNAIAVMANGYSDQGFVYAPAGVYLITTLDFGGVGLIGDGQVITGRPPKDDASYDDNASFGGTLLRTNVASGNVLHFGISGNYDYGRTIRDFALVGPASNTAVGIVIEDYVSAYIQHVRVANLGTGVQIDYAEDCLFEALAISGCTIGLEVTTTVGTNQNTFVQLELNQCATSLNALSGNNNSFFGGLVQGGTDLVDGVILNGAQAYIFHNVWFEATWSGDAIRTTGAACTRHRFIDCRLGQTAVNTISLGTTSGAAGGHQFINFAGGNNSTLTIDSGVTDCVIDNSGAITLVDNAALTTVIQDGAHRPYYFQADYDRGQTRSTTARAPIQLAGMAGSGTEYVLYGADTNPTALFSLSVVNGARLDLRDASGTLCHQWQFDGDGYLLKDLEIDGALNHDGTTAGFYGTAPVAQQTGVAVSDAAIHAALVNLGLITA